MSYFIILNDKIKLNIIKPLLDNSEGTSESRVA